MVGTRLLLRRFTTLSREQIVARQATLDLIDKSPVFVEAAHVVPKRFDPEFYLDHHPDPETALKIRTQMNELAVLIEKVNARQQTANQAMVWAATMFLTSSICYGMFQLGDVNTTLTTCMPSVFRLLDYSTARKFICQLAAYDMLPVDYASEDPYMIRNINFASLHPKTRPMRVCIPIGLGAGIDVDGVGPASFVKLGFGFVEVGTVSVSPATSSSTGKVHLLPASVVSSETRTEASEGLSVVADRLCDYIQYKRPSDLLSRNTVTGITIRISDEKDVEEVFKNVRLIEHVDFISLDVTELPNNQLSAIVESVNSACNSSHIKSIPPLFLKVSMSQSFPPEESVSKAILDSEYLVGVNINGEGVAPGKTDNGTPVFPGIFEPTEEVLVAGLAVRDKSTEAVSAWYTALGGGKRGKHIIASGGVSTGKDALAKIEAGASMVSVLSAFVLDGPQVARRIKTQLSIQLMNQSYVNIEEAIGSRHRRSNSLRQHNLKKRKLF